MTTNGNFKMRNSFVLVFLLGCFCLGVSALKCNVCEGKGCTKEQEKECDKEFDRCLDVALYARSINPWGHGKTSYWRKTVQVDKLCADERMERKMCRKAEKKVYRGFCKSCQEDGCNKESRKEMADRVEKGKKEKHERKAEKREAKRQKKIRKEEKKKLKHQKDQEKEERKKAENQAKHDKEVKKEERKKQEEEANQNKKEEKQEKKKAENVKKDEKKAKEKEKEAEKIKESPK